MKKSIEYKINNKKMKCLCKDSLSTKIIIVNNKKCSTITTNRQVWLKTDYTMVFLHNIIHNIIKILKEIKTCIKTMNIILCEKI